MSQHKNELNLFNPAPPYDKEWFKLFGELCYEVFYKNQHGAKLLALLENKYFRSPVAHPMRDASWAYFNEGQNEIIRSFTLGIQGHLSLSDARDKVQKELSEAMPRKGRARKSTIRPVR